MLILFTYFWMKVDPWIHGTTDPVHIRELGERLAAFGLDVEPSKTAVLRFGTQTTRDCHRDRLRRPQTFSFPGLTHYVSRSRRGRFVVGRKTERKRFTGKLKLLNERLHRPRWAGGKAMMAFVRRHLEGPSVTMG